MSIRWPKEWDPKEGWPQLRTGRSQTLTCLKSDPRKWASLNKALYLTAGERVTKRILDLGGPGGLNLDRSVDSIREEAQKFYTVTGQRPGPTTSLDWRKNWVFLRRNGTSLEEICDELGLGGGKWRSEKHIQKEMRLFHAQHGRPPSCTTSSQWRRADKIGRAHV